jgi:hypothetical protein
LRGPVFGQALLEHRLDGSGLLGRAELEASYVLDRSVRLFAGAVADHGRDLDEPELAGRGDAVEAGDELVLEAGGGDVGLCGADDDRDEHPLQRDRRRERVDVLGVERAHVLRDVDPRERRVSPPAAVDAVVAIRPLLECGGPARLAGPLPDSPAPARVRTWGGERACHPD